jgi:uncharacterized protein YbbC (DUF1343 family)
MIRLAFLILVVCCRPQEVENKTTSSTKTKVITGADQLDLLLPALGDARVGLVVNHTARIGQIHLADTLKKRGVRLVAVFAPEHGFRGTADAGELIQDGSDPQTGLPVISLYGNNKKPTADQLRSIDIVVFDIQDVGARFYTYISTLHFVMEACAENNKKLIVLDRPNPNGSYVDGPVLEPQHRSFVGMHPIPVVHGLTVGEMARMINGEGWLNGGIACDLTVIPVKNWKHDDFYSLPVKPSPNLPNDQAIRLYPSICLFEGTVVSVARGTPFPFQAIGHPELKNQPFQFTPISIPGMAKHPPYENQTCYGLDLRQVAVKPRLDISYLIQMYQAFPHKDKFFTPYFDKLAGTTTLRSQIMQGMTEEQIRQSWQKDLDAFREKRRKYLLYP